jgi:DNA-binding MarR family transcriptional regulator
MIDRLVAKKQVRRVRHPEDGRSYVLEPTAKGKATSAPNGKRFERTIERLRANLDGDAEEILDAMRRLETALRTTPQRLTPRPKPLAAAAYLALRLRD